MTTQRRISITEIPESTYENGYWFLHNDVLHRTAPKQAFVFALNTIEPWAARHAGPDNNGIFWSAFIVTDEDEVIERGCSIDQRCEICFA